MMKRSSRIDSGVGLDLIKEKTFKSQLRRARRMSVATKSNQKKVVSTLVLITTMFTIVNIPSAISRIMSNSEWKNVKSFQVCILNLEFRQISRSAHQTPNFTNPEYFVCLLFEYFFQIKV